jgi:hypothetical protein
MSGVGGVSNAGPITSGAPIQGGGLTPDAVMTYCASQLNHLDEGIKKHMAQQEIARDQQNKLGKLKAIMAGAQNADAVDMKVQIMSAMKEAYDSLPANDPGRDQLNKTFHEYITSACFADKGDARRATGDTYNLFNLDAQKIGALANMDIHNGDNGISADEMKRYAGMVDPVLSDVGKGAELEMINLQSLVSQRQMAVQISTQMLSKMNETYMSIVNGIK